DHPDHHQFREAYVEHVSLRTKRRPVGRLLIADRRAAQAFCSVLPFTSPSIVLLAIGASDFSPPSRMPSLKPRTAPPRSAPMLRRFWVPKISITIRRTISQCQMLNEPITYLLFPFLFPCYFRLISIGPSGSGPPRTCMWT